MPELRNREHCGWTSCRPGLKNRAVSGETFASLTYRDSITSQPTPRSPVNNVTDEAFVNFELPYDGTLCPSVRNQLSNLQHVLLSEFSAAIPFAAHILLGVMENRPTPRGGFL